MTDVTVKFNHQNFHLACKEGEQDHLRKLAEYVDGKAAEIVEKMGAVTDIRLLLMTSILIADELNDAREGKTLADSGAGSKLHDLEDTLTHTLERIENITRQVEGDGNGFL